MKVNEVLALIQSICLVKPLTLGIRDRGRLVAERYRLNVYEAMIAAALIAGCKTLYSEDMQDGLLIDARAMAGAPSIEQTLISLHAYADS